MVSNSYCTDITKYLSLTDNCLRQFNLLSKSKYYSKQLENELNNILKTHNEAESLLLKDDSPMGVGIWSQHYKFKSDILTALSRNNEAIEYLEKAIYLTKKSNYSKKQEIIQKYEESIDWLNKNNQINKKKQINLITILSFFKNYWSFIIIIIVLMFYLYNA